MELSEAHTDWRGARGGWGCSFFCLGGGEVFSFLPEHLTQALQHALLGFVLVLVSVAVGLLLLLPPAAGLVSVPLSVLCGQAAVQPRPHDVVAAGGHRLRTRLGASFCVLVHWGQKDEKRDGEKKKINNRN